jgi:hypothetical protein
MSDVAASLSELYNWRLNEQMPVAVALSDALLHADTLVGAATAWSDQTTLKAVQQFAAVVSDLFESFVTKEHDVLERLNLAGKLPPLVTFATEPARGPTTLNAQVVRSYCGADISIVSQPACYAEYPVLWGVLAHEVGGHAVTHAIPGLAGELNKTVVRAARLSPLGADLWEHWVEEAAADVYALLNVGPSFVLGLAAWLKMARKPPRFDSAIWFVAGTPEDNHPVDLLRLYTLRGALKEMKGLGRAKDAWLDDINAVIKSVTNEIGYIEFYYTDPLSPRHLPLAQLAVDAERVGATIVKQELRALDDRSIGDIETWDDDDEEVALEIKCAMVSNQALPVRGVDDARLIAGATMALCEGAPICSRINRMLGEAFAESYANDSKLNRLCDVRPG